MFSSGILLRVSGSPGTFVKSSRFLSPPAESEGPSSRAVSGPTDALRASRTWVRGLFQAGGLPSAEVGCGIDVSTSFLF